MSSRGTGIGNPGREHNQTEIAVSRVDHGHQVDRFFTRLLVGGGTSMFAIFVCFADAYLALRTGGQEAMERKDVTYPDGFFFAFYICNVHSVMLCPRMECWFIVAGAAATSRMTINLQVL